MLSDELLAPVGEDSPHSFRLLPLSCCSGGPSSQVPTKTALRSAVRPVPVDAALLRPVHSLPATIQPRFNFVQLSSNLSLRFTLVFLVRCFLCHLPPLVLGRLCETQLGRRANESDFANGKSHQRRKICDNVCEGLYKQTLLETVRKEQAREYL